MDSADRLRLIREAENALHAVVEDHGFMCQCPCCQAWHRLYRTMRDIEQPGRDLLDPWCSAAKEATP